MNPLLTTSLDRVRIIKLSSAIYLSMLLISCGTVSTAQYMGKSDRAFVEDEDAMFSTTGDRKEWAYWHQTQSGCKVADTAELKDYQLVWSGKCVSGYVEGCGKLIVTYNSQQVVAYEGCYVAGRKQGKVTFISEAGQNNRITYTYEAGRKLPGTQLDSSYALSRDQITANLAAASKRDQAEKAAATEAAANTTAILSAVSAYQSIVSSRIENSTAAAERQAAETARRTAAAAETARHTAAAAEQKRQADLTVEKANLEALDRLQRERQGAAQAAQDKKADAARRAEVDRQIQQSHVQAERDINARQASLKYANDQAAMRQRSEEERQRRAKAEQDRLEQRRREELQRKKTDDDAQFRGYSAVSGRTNLNTIQVTSGILAETATTSEGTITGMPCADGVQVFNESGKAASVTVNVRWLQKYDCRMEGCSFRNAYDSFIIKLRSPDARMVQFPMDMRDDIRVRGPGGLTCNGIYIERASVTYLD